MSNLISAATTRNWAKLHTNSDGRLTGRANKRRSAKNIIPAEYLTHSENSVVIENIVRSIRENNLPTDKALYSVGIVLLRNVCIADCDHVRKTLNEYNIQPDETLLQVECPTNENDLLGYIYQCLMTEGHKNIIGSYYTPPGIVRNMTERLDFSQGQTFLDPCCGSGAYLMSLNCSNPQQLFGMDRDRIAVMICRINLLIKYCDKAFVPQIYCEDFLLTQRFADMRFDYIVTNPPWGAASQSGKTSHGQPERMGISGETFTHFFVRSYEMLRCGGRMRFLFPYSVLNVKTHKELRRFMLEHGNLRMITVYDRVFSGVTTDCVDIELHNCESEEAMTVCSGGRKYETNKQWIDKTHNCAFHLMSEESHSVVELVYRHPHRTLAGSQWALGIVTGDNNAKLRDEPADGDEPIYTGKEITAYRLLRPKKFIRFEPDHFQQCAPAEMYRAKEKLVYKFIANRPIFAFDDSGSLFLNSANILIPHIQGMSVKTVMAFLNSDLFAFLYRTLFGEIKILQGNLTQLPFAEINADTDRMITEMVDGILSGQTCLHEDIQNVIADIYHLSDEMRRIVRG